MIAASSAKFAGGPQKPDYWTPFLVERNQIIGPSRLGIHSPAPLGLKRKGKLLSYGPLYTIRAGESSREKGRKTKATSISQNEGYNADSTEYAVYALQFQTQVIKVAET